MNMNYNNRYQTEENTKGEPAYLSNKKKRYYLASANENINMITEHQKKELSNILFDLRSQHDKLTLDTSVKVIEEAELKKKIYQIEERHKEIKKSLKERQKKLSSIRSSTEIKQSKKTDELYEKKILLSNTDRLKVDILLTNKNILQYQEEENKYDKEINKSVFIHNDQKSKFNTICLKIKDQNKINEKEKYEQLLKLDYYQEIIDHKIAFIESADERKKRQKIIADKSKNNTHDVNEIQLRRKLNLLKIVNNYYELKMDKMLKANQELEESFSNIRDICGTQNLSKISELICEKNKIYSAKTKLVEETERQKGLLKSHLQNVENEYKIILSETVLKDQNTKTIEVLESNKNTQEEEKLIEKENKLRIDLENCKQNLLQVELSYHKTIENIKYLYKIHFNEFDKGKCNYGESYNDINNTRNISTLETNNEMSSSRVGEIEENKGNSHNGNEKISKDLNNEEKAISNFKEFLTGSFDAFTKLFFCYSKHDFIKVMKQMGIEEKNDGNDNRNGNGYHLSSRNLVRRPTKSSLASKSNNRSLIRRRTRELYTPVSIEEVKKNPRENEDDDDINPNEKQNQKDIMVNFLNEIKREKEEYLRIVKRKKAIQQK